jgi:hypothetical protein
MNATSGPIATIVPPRVWPFSNLKILPRRSEGVSPFRRGGQSLMLALDCVGDLSIGKYKRGEVTSRPRRDAASARRRFSHRFHEKLWRDLDVAPRILKRAGGRCASPKTTSQAFQSAAALFRLKRSGEPGCPTDCVPEFGKPQPTRSSSGTRRRRGFPRVGRGAGDVT